MDAQSNSGMGSSNIAQNDSQPRVQPNLMMRNQDRSFMVEAMDDLENAVMEEEGDEINNLTWSKNQKGGVAVMHRGHT